MKLLTSLCVALTCALVAPGAVAQRPPQSVSAEAHYAFATQLYSAGRFAEAAVEFDLAWRASQRAELLFNLARAQEDAGQLDAALATYTRFEAAGAPGYDRITLRARVDLLRHRIAARDTARDTTVTPSPTPVVPIAPPRHVTETRGYALPAALLSIGGAAIISALPLWISASSTISDLENRCPSRRCATEDLALRDGAQTRAIIGDALAGVGIASLTVGAVLLGSTLSQPDAPRVTAACVPGLCAASATVAF